MGVDANRYIGDTRWHPDHRVDPTEDCYGIKFAFYLDAVGPDTGALRLVPGSHKNPLHDDLRAYIQGQGLELADIPSCAPTPPSRATSSPLTCAAGTPALAGDGDAA